MASWVLVARPPIKRNFCVLLNSPITLGKALGLSFIRLLVIRIKMVHFPDKSYL